MHRAVMTVALVVGLLGVAIGDELKKKDGTVLEGEVIAEDEESVTIRHKLGDIRTCRNEHEDERDRAQRAAGQSLLIAQGQHPPHELERRRVKGNARAR